MKYMQGRRFNLRLSDQKKNSFGDSFLCIYVWLEHFYRKILVFVLDVTQE